MGPSNAHGPHHCAVKSVITRPLASAISLSYSLSVVASMTRESGSEAYCLRRDDAFNELQPTRASAGSELRASRAQRSISLKENDRDARSGRLDQI